MALTTYRIQFSKQFLSYNGGETGWFTADVAQQIVALGAGTALDALPGTNPTVSPTQATDVITDQTITAVPTSSADSQALAGEAAMLPG